MTRWARGTDSNRKKVHEGSSWKELKTNPSANRTSNSSGTSINKKASYCKSGNKNFKQKAKYFYQEGGWKTLSKKDEDDSELLVKLKKPDDESKPKGLAAELEELRKSADLSAEDKQEISAIVKKEERRENRRLKRKQERQDNITCYHCREAGHDMSSCPRLAGSLDQGQGVCFKCGSTEHSLRKCRVKVPPGQYPFAKCFICGEQGHLSNQCVDNPRGLYPNGGCCRECGSVEHYKKDCPDLQQKQGIEPIALPTFDTSHQSLDAEVTDRPRSEKVKKKGPKIVNF